MRHHLVVHWGDIFTGTLGGGTRVASSHMLGTKALSDAPHEALFLNYSHFLNKGYQVIHTFY